MSDNYIMNMEGKKMLRIVKNSCLSMFVCIYLADANASTFLLESEVNARAVVDDNVSLSTTNTDNSTTILTITPEAKLTYHDESWDTSSKASISGTTYSEQLQNELDSYIDFGTAYKEDKGTYSIYTSFNNQANRASETDVLNNGVEQVDTRTFSIKPNYKHNITQRVSLSVAYNFSSVDYGHDTVGRFFSYDTQTASGIIDYKLSKRSNINLMISSMDYESDNGASEFQFLSTKVGYTHNLSEIMTASISAGVNSREFVDRSSNSFPFFGSLVTGVTELESSSSGSSYSASFDAKWVTLGASRDYSSSTVGGLRINDKVDAKLRMQITSLVGISLSLAHLKSEELNAYVPGYSEVVTTFRPAINFKLAHNLSLRGEYVHSEKDIDSAGQTGTTKSNQYFVNMRYIFPTL